MRVIGVATVALLAAVCWSMAGRVEAVPASSHRLQNQHVLQEDSEAEAEAVTGLHDECLKEVGKHLMDWELPTFGPDMFVKGRVVAKPELKLNQYWPKTVTDRAICKKNANWLWELFCATGTLTPHRYGVSPSAGDNELLKTWHTSALWENSNAHHFGSSGRVCYMEVVDGNVGSPITHQWVLEAPTDQLVRHYQSFVGCYTLNEWMHSGKEPQEGTAYSSGCDYLAARAAHGGGQLLTRGQKATDTYVANLQAIIDAIHKGADFSTVSQAYADLFGVTAPKGFNWTKPKLFMKCVDRVPLTCSNQQQAVHHELSRFRRELKAVSLPSDKEDDTYMSHAEIGAWEAAITHATNKGWTAAANNLRKSITNYKKYVDTRAAKYCEDGERQYRVVVRANSQFMALKDEVDTITKLQKSVSVTATLQVNPLALRVANKSVASVVALLTCKVDASQKTFVDNGVGKAYTPACEGFGLTVGGKALNGRIARGSWWGASRWELQFCMDKQQQPTKARWIPSESIQ